MIHRLIKAPVCNLLAWHRRASFGGVSLGKVPRNERMMAEYMERMQIESRKQAAHQLMAQVYNDLGITDFETERSSDESDRRLPRSREEWRRLLHTKAISNSTASSASTTQPRSSTATLDTVPPPSEMAIDYAWNHMLKTFFPLRFANEVRVRREEFERALSTMFVDMKANTQANAAHQYGRGLSKAESTFILQRILKRPVSPDEVDRMWLAKEIEVGNTPVEDNRIPYG